MDLGFFRRGSLDAADRSSAGVDFGVLTAALHSHQSGSVTARMQARGFSRGGLPVCPQDALAEILLGGPRWREAVDEQRGSFNTAHARARGSYV